MESTALDFRASKKSQPVDSSAFDDNPLDVFESRSRHPFCFQLRCGLMVNPYTAPEYQAADVQSSGNGGTLESVAIWFARIGAIFCGLLVVAILITTFWGFTIRSGDTGGAMGVGLTFMIFLPLASIPVGLICLAAAICSRIALKRQSSPNAQISFRLAMGAPIAVVAVYALCSLMLLLAARV